MDILLTGSVAYDYLMKFPGYFKEHILPDHLDSISLSFLVESMTRQRGGVAPNIAYSLALLGGKPRLWAAVGEDFDDYRTWLQAKNIDDLGAQVIPGVYTASFFVNTDLSNAQIASFYPGAMAFASQLSLKALTGTTPELVVISPNDPEAMKLYVEECQELGWPYVYDPSQQIVRLTEKDLRAGILGAHALFVNEYESALIEKMTGWGPERLLDANPDLLIVVTLGKDGALVMRGVERFEIPIVEPIKIEDPTGVGDAFRGGSLTGYSFALDLQTCGRMGALAATYCLESNGPQGHCYTTSEFVERFGAVFGNSKALNVLIQ